jgi:type IV secretion system protein VirD4
MIGSRKPPPRRGAMAALAIACLVALLCSSAATQFIASRLGYHPALGTPFVGQLYPPWAWLSWNARYRKQMPAVFAPVHAAGGAMGMIAALASLLALSSRGRTAERHEGVHGTAHWAERVEIEASGLLPRRAQRGEGVYVGGWQDERGRLQYLRHNGPEHIAAIAQPAPAKVLASSCRPCCLGRTLWWSTIRRPSSGI